MDAVRWQRLDGPGHEVCRITSANGEWQLTGAAVFSQEGQPCDLFYRVTCDSDWRTLSAQIWGTIGNSDINLDVVVDEDQQWAVNGSECAAIFGCIDIDLGFSPATNLLPIRRLSLDVGNEAEVNAAWFPFPSFEPERLFQRYRREGQHSYRYESAGGTFKETLEVDDSGFVVLYPGLWQQTDTRHE